MEERKSMESLLEGLVCPRMGKAVTICICSSCTQPAVSCFQESCQSCSNGHKKCQMMRVAGLLEQVVSKNQVMTTEISKAIQTMEKVYDEAIERLSKDKDYITRQIEMFGYNQYEVDLMRLIKDGVPNQITGQLVAKVSANISIKEEWLANEEVISRYWQKHKKEFQTIFDKLKLIRAKPYCRLDSLITDQIIKIEEFFDDEIVEEFELMYRASEQKYSVQNFHRKCDGVENTLVLIKTEFGRIIGGFTVMPWGGGGNYVADNSNKSFIFSLTFNQKYALTQPQYSICSSITTGPTFGGGHDISIADNANSNTSSYFNFPHSYNRVGNGPQINVDANSYQRFSGATGGSYHATIPEWEVFKVTFKQLQKKGKK